LNMPEMQQRGGGAQAANRRQSRDKGSEYEKSTTSSPRRRGEGELAGELKHHDADARTDGPQALDVPRDAWLAETAFHSPFGLEKGIAVRSNTPSSNRSLLTSSPWNALVPQCSGSSSMTSSTSAPPQSSSSAL